MSTSTYWANRIRVVTLTSVGFVGEGCNIVLITSETDGFDPSFEQPGRSESLQVEEQLVIVVVVEGVEVD